MCFFAVRVAFLAFGQHHLCMQNGALRSDAHVYIGARVRVDNELMRSFVLGLMMDVLTSVERVSS